MHAFDLKSVADLELLEGLDRALGCEQRSTSHVVAHVAEVDERGTYRVRGYDSMHAYAVEWCHLSEDAAYRRIQAARAARRFPCLFEELSAGRLNLSAVCLLAPHLTPENCGEFVEAARHRSNARIKDWLAERLWTRTTSPNPVPPARQLRVPLPRFRDRRLGPRRLRSAGRKRSPPCPSTTR